jgi:plastocyanin
VAGASLVAACGKGSSEPRGSVPSGQRTTASTGGGGDSVTIRLVAFNPPTLNAKATTTVTWTQKDPGSFHTVTSGTVETDAIGISSTHPDGQFDSGQLAENTTFSFTFPAPGTYPYFCSIHPATMRGEVHVN